MEPRFEIIEHTADTGFEVVAEKIEDIVSESVKALSLIYFGDIKPSHPRKILVKSIGFDETSSLISFLNELIYLFDVRKMVFFYAENIKISYGKDIEISGEVIVENFSPNKHNPKIYIKAITYAGEGIKKEVKQNENNQIIKIKIIVDI